MKWAYRIFLIVAAAGLLFQRFDTSNTEAKIIGLIFLVVAITGIIFDHNIASWICKFIFLPVLIVYWTVRNIFAKTTKTVKPITFEEMFLYDIFFGDY